MSISNARMIANRANAQKSTGPKTTDGKSTSRRNSLKHGMAGEGFVVPDEETAEVERRAKAMLLEMGPKTELGRHLVRQVAELTVRVESCSKQVRAANALNIAHAEEDFDEARLAEVDSLLSSIGREPTTLTRKLRSMPEGVDRLVAEILGLRDDLELGGRWDEKSGERLAELTGSRWLEIPVHRIRALTEALNGRFQFLMPGEGEGLDVETRQLWARIELLALIDQELDVLVELRGTIDEDSVAVDRAGAADRAWFSTSKEATLARRYEAAARRDLSKALKEFREVEAQAAAVAQATPEPAPEPPLASFRAPAPTPRPPSPAPRVSVEVPAPAHPLATYDRSKDAPQSVGMVEPGRFRG